MLWLKIKKLIKTIIKLIFPHPVINITFSPVTSSIMLKGRRILITGGSRGIGYAMAKRFVESGANVIITGRDSSTLEKAAKEIGDNCFFEVLDNSKIELFPEFLKKIGHVDSLVCNAGISLHEGNFRNVTPDSFDKQYNINLRGTYFLCKAFIELKESEKANRADILVTSSETGDFAYDIPYGLTKASINSFIRGLSQRVCKEGFRVNAIAPGVTNTDMTNNYAPVVDGDLSFNNRAGRVFLPEEVAEVALFLLSDASKCINGEVIHTNSGNHVNPIF